MRFLFEIGLEELPARYVDEAEKSFKQQFINVLADYRIKYDDIKTYNSPRRIAVYIDGLKEKQEDLNVKKIGPSVEISYKDGELTKAGLGFIKSANANIEDIRIIENEKGKYISIEKHEIGLFTKDILDNILDEIIRSIEFEKSMKWNTRSFRFARPIKWIVAMLDNQILDFTFEGIKASNKTRGLRFFTPDNIIIEDITKYEEILSENLVIVDSKKRREMILDSIHSNCEDNGDEVIINKYLLDEVVNIVEYPYAIKGEFDKNYLELPEELITITMETHQRYFPVKNNGKLTNKFVLIRNANEYSEFVKKGNEKVIEPRLSDAKFFFDEDIKIPLEKNVEKLKNVLFQKDMGSIYEKIQRSLKIANILVDKLHLEDKREDISRAILLSKADLVSNVISEKEFTKLQGFMGSIYAMKQGEKENVSNAIFEHYLPRNQKDKLPASIEGAIAGISDKIDTVIGCFCVGLIPTSSKDPYALKKAANGILSVMLDMELDIDYMDLIENTYKIFAEDKKIINVNALDNIKEFMKQRVEASLLDKYSKDIIGYEINIEYNIRKLNDKLSILFELSKREEFNILINLLKRMKNIVDDKIYDNGINTSLFQNKYEEELYNTYILLEKRKDFKNLVDILLDRADSINDFFDNNKINDDDENIRKNRYILLNNISNIVNKAIEL